MLILVLLLDPLDFLLPRVAITLDTCYRSGIFQAFTLQSIKKQIDYHYGYYQSFCFRLGIIQGGSHIFIAPIIAMMSLEKWKCPTTLESKLYV